VTSDGAIARLLRLHVVPILFPLITKLPSLRRVMFRTVSQTAVHYRQSSLSEGRAGAVRGGDRLPWVSVNDEGDGDNFTSLRSLSWQVHTYGASTPDIQAVCDGRRLPLHVFPWCSAMGRAGLLRNAIYLVRPDGYIALVNAEGTASAITSYLDARKLR
jgi:hypothetical protein